MKYAAIFFVILTLAAAGVACYAWMNTALVVTDCTVTPLSGEEKVREFSRCREMLDNRAVIGTPFTEYTVSDIDDYALYTVRVSLKNNGLLPAEMVELQVAPVEGDVLTYGQSALASNTTYDIVNPGEEREVWLVLLTDARAHTVRDLHITYYIWGHPFDVKYTHG